MQTQRINITDINSGWATFQLDNLSFRVSYLTDVKTEIEKIFAIDDEFTQFKNDVCPTRTLIFDGEGNDLLLTVRSEYNHYIIIWEQKSSQFYKQEIYEQNMLVKLIFPKEELFRQWQELWDKIKDDYTKIFEI